MQKAAFFDVDGTIFRSSLLIELTERFIDEGVFNKDVRFEYKHAYEAWLNREGEYEAYIMGVVKSFMQHIKGVPYGDFADIGRVVVEGQSKRVYRYTRDLIKALKADDYFVVAISQSPKSILDSFCSSYGFDKVYGRLYEMDEEQHVMTGNVIDEAIISNKANIVARVFEKYDIAKEGSVGVGDTEGDIPLLASVENPICFNPNKLLYDHAQKEGWKVVVERKDVIYEL